MVFHVQVKQFLRFCIYILIENSTKSHETSGYF
jgi:hypothetical protein